MPDFSMCQNKECPQKQDCLRFTATPDMYQSYSQFRPINGECVHFKPDKTK